MERRLICCHNAILLDDLDNRSRRCTNENRELGQESNKTQQDGEAASNDASIVRGQTGMELLGLLRCFKVLRLTALV